MKRLIRLFCFATAANALVGAAMADEPMIETVSAEHSNMGWKIAVTLSHPDEGWDHFADGWEVMDRLGNQIGFRELMHPHVQEQPFTRSLFDVMVPDGERVIFIRARCSRDGWSDRMTKVVLER